MWPWNASTMGEVYILHFSAPVGNAANARALASHYCGFSDDLEARLKAHRAGKGSKLVAAAVKQGITFEVFHWAAPLAVEKLIKRRKETAVFCPACARARGRIARPLPSLAIQLTLDLVEADDLPDVPVGKMDWLEIKIQAEWRSLRIPTPAGIDDDLL